MAETDGEPKPTEKSGFAQWWAKTREEVRRRYERADWVERLLIYLGAGFVVLFVVLAPPILVRVVGAAWVFANPEDLNRLLLALGGLVGAPLVVWRVLIAYHQNQIADRQREIAQEKLYVELLTKAVEQLGATREKKTPRETKEEKGGKEVVTTETISETVPNLEVRLGAIYALEKLARDYLPLHWQIMEILCAYVRENAGPPQPIPVQIRALLAMSAAQRTDAERAQIESYKGELSRPRVDVQAALTVIGRRGSTQRAFEDERRGKQLGAYRLDLGNSNLVLATLSGLWFGNARFDEAKMSFANLDGAVLRAATFTSARLEGISLIEADLEGAWLGGACLQGANLWRAHLEGASLRESNLEGAELDRAHLERTSLFRANLGGASLDWAHLECASFSGTRLEGASLGGARIDGAYLREVNFKGTFLFDASLDGAWLGNVDLSSVEDVTLDQLALAWGTGGTILPTGMLHPTNARWVDDDDSNQVHFGRWHSSLPREHPFRTPPDIHPSSTPR